jgi:antitoxin ParD1/3/4
MHVSLTPEQEKFVNDKVKSGRYHSPSEVIREALRLLEDHDSLRAARLAEFNEAIGRRLTSLDRSESLDPAEARARFERKSKQARKP